jgi:2-dehydro-3-deoxyphosphooctonate aldolase (KDO 8-P synthase)
VNDNRDILILGPCALDSEELFYEVTEYIFKNVYPIVKDSTRLIVKGSYDKANRTSLHGRRGIGIDEGIRIFREIRKKYTCLEFTTDVHDIYQVEKLVGAVDIIQIPAFLSRQTDLVVECAKHFPVVNIKKMQGLSPENVIKSVDKIYEVNSNAKAWLTERGTHYGYSHLIVDFTIVEKIKKHYDKFIFDVTHSVQRSRSFYKCQGDRKLAEKYFLSSKIFGYDGAFLEIHPRPNESSSDGDCMILLEHVKKLVEQRNLIGKVL